MREPPGLFTLCFFFATLAMLCLASYQLGSSQGYSRGFSDGRALGKAEQTVHDFCQYTRRCERSSA